MPPSEAVLLLKLLKSADQNRTLKLKNDALGFLKEVKVAFEYKMRKYDKFVKVLRDFKAKRIHISEVKAKLKRLFKGHKDLIAGFNNLMTKKVKKRRITPSLGYDSSVFLKALERAFQHKNNYEDFMKATMDYNDQRIDRRSFVKQVKVLLAGKRNKICQLPWDVLDVIYQKLDFDDLFRFGCVCTNLRDFHKSNFMASQEPLLVEIPGNEVPDSFSSLTNQKVYSLEKMMEKMMTYASIYVTYSSGYFIMAHSNNLFILFNPFTRIKKGIYTSPTFEVNNLFGKYHALLAFEKCSEEEFVLVVLCKKSGSLHVYQSRKNSWFTCSTAGKVVVDFVVLHNMIYVVTNKAKIGVLNLNSGNINFLQLENTSTIKLTLLQDKKIQPYPNLVNCDEQLLVVDLAPGSYKKLIYKIDLSSMSYVEMNTLGDIALFYICCGSCKALSSPNRWGYKSNHVYQANRFSSSCIIEYNWDKRRKNEKSEKHIQLPRPKKTCNSAFDWCFRHLKYQVDY